MKTPPTAQPMPASRRPRRWLRSLLPALSLLALVLIIGGIAAVLVVLGIDLQRQHSALASFRPWGAAIQGALFVLIGLRWTQVVNWGRHRGIVQEWEYEQAVASRGKAMLFLLAYWLMIPVGPNALLQVLGS